MEGVTTGANICCFPCHWLDSSPFIHLQVIQRHLWTRQTRQLFKYSLGHVPKLQRHGKICYMHRNVNHANTSEYQEVKSQAQADTSFSLWFLFFGGSSRDRCCLVAASPATWPHHGQQSKLMNKSVYLVSTQTKMRDFFKTQKIGTLQILQLNWGSSMYLSLQAVFQMTKAIEKANPERKSGVGL